MGDSLVLEACSRLGVEHTRELRGGAQKSVHLVSRGAEPLVLKLVSTASTNPEALERARREVDLLASIDHPNVVSVRSPLTVVSPTHVAWLEEFLDGDDIFTSFGQPWGEEEVVRLGLHVGAGVGTMHSRNVVHRDLSPHNIRVTSNGRFVVMDPGFARHTLLSPLTVGGQPGTRSFMSPEHVLGNVTPASDVFQVGVLMYTAATGSPPIPWHGDDVNYAQRLITASHKPISVARPDLEDRVGGVITRALHAQPARRFRNGAQLVSALEELG